MEKQETAFDDCITSTIEELYYTYYTVTVELNLNNYSQWHWLCNASYVGVSIFQVLKIVSGNTSL